MSCWARSWLLRRNESRPPCMRDDDWVWIASGPLVYTSIPLHSRDRRPKTVKTKMKQNQNIENQTKTKSKQNKRNENQTETDWKQLLSGVAWRSRSKPIWNRFRILSMSKIWKPFWKQNVLVWFPETLLKPFWNHSETKWKRFRNEPKNAMETVLKLFFQTMWP